MSSERRPAEAAAHSLLAHLRARMAEEWGNVTPLIDVDELTDLLHRELRRDPTPTAPKGADGVGGGLSVRRARPPLGGCVHPAPTRRRLTPAELSALHRKRLEHALPRR